MTARLKAVPTCEPERIDIAGHWANAPEAHRAGRHSPSRNLRCVSALSGDHRLSRRGPSERFLNLTRNTALESPRKFVPTKKGAGDVVI
jgi:hypothetical protein